MNFDPLMYAQFKDNRLGKVEKVLEDRFLLVWFHIDGPPERVSADQVEEILSPNAYRKRFLRQKGIII